jgi:large subunit ribosomal protein L18
MAIHKKTNVKRKGRIRRKIRVRKKVRGDGVRPRLAVYRSNQHIYAQIIDDVLGVTLACASTLEKTYTDKKNSGNREGAKKIGKLVAERALAKSVKEVRFDRNGFAYHGRVMALAEGAREGGLKF